MKHYHFVNVQPFASKYNAILEGPFSKKLCKAMVNYISSARAIVAETFAFERWEAHKSSHFSQFEKTFYLEKSNYEIIRGESGCSHSL
jgi:hypothetical protein